MIVKENLFIDNKFSIEKSVGSYQNKSIKFNTLNLSDGQDYALTSLCRQTNRGSGNYDIIIFREREGDSYKGWTLTCNELNVITFKYDEKVMDRINFYTDLAGSTSGVGAEFLYVKLEPGDIATQYLPHKSNVKAENQAIFPIGGVSRHLPSIEDMRGVVYED